MRSAFPSELNSFIYTGKTIVGNVTANVFTLADDKKAKLNYTYIVSEEGTPLQYSYIGFSNPSFINSPNYDWFLMSYSKYSAGYFNQSYFDIPNDCVPGNAISHTERLSHLLHFGEDVAFEEFISEHKKVYSGEEEKQKRKKIFHDNLSKIVNHRWSVILKRMIFPSHYKFLETF